MHTHVVAGATEATAQVSALSEFQMAGRPEDGRMAQETGWDCQEEWSINMTSDELRALADALLFRTHVTGPQFEEVRTKAASYLRACADAVPFAYGLKDNIGEIDHDLIGSKADCEFWARAEGERQSGWTVVPLYASPVVAQPLTQSHIDAILNASRLEDEGPTKLIRRVERAVRGQP
jgi:hypothetical protein